MLLQAILEEVENDKKGTGFHTEYIITICYYIVTISWFTKFAFFNFQMNLAGPNFVFSSIIIQCVVGKVIDNTANPIAITPHSQTSTFWFVANKTGFLFCPKNE